MTSVLQNDFTCKVSSVLNKDSKQFGKKYLFDGKEETCWNSDQGSPQSISLTFADEVTVSTFTIQFQGGFVGQNCWLKSVRADGSVNDPQPFYPEDISAAQKFFLTNPISAQQLEFIFEKSSDFFGRIIIYKLDILTPDEYIP